MIRKSGREPRHQGASPLGRGAEGVDRGVGPGGKARSKGGMVKMRMGHDDVADPLTGTDRGKDTFQMCRDVGSGIDHDKIG